MNATLLDWAGKILVGGALAFWLYRDARSRDFSWMMWMLSPFILLFFPPLFWVVPAFLLPLVYIGFRPRGRMLVCPHCKKKAHEELAFCPFCRRSIKRECLKCHRTVPWESISCSHCHSTALTDT